ncbi:DeoR/GlpR family DNA-binding transcription regulator [Petroclostridium sp. X23]|uniref:DeoR/GlpR family DNA-binding transcription regulator n=1 Tax=Petroclostridium sp. X23 TaxID=3045146 RepID=UPI0024AD3DC3|nr:DeoR/GlpR family DNA-binding transcription regulator [Petroclostridium sp. X23]WHH57269.1 DeoR/GlpR family DNA-binding transcription regulator [Petroclostridium sp. X23]
MFAAERLKKIRQILTEYKKAEVNSLSSLLTVSEVTIRKDLERLEQEGFLTRTHGGAILNEKNVLTENYNVLDITELEHKKMIGLIAAQMINDNEAVYIGVGTTCLQIAKNIKDKKNITIVTNNVTAALELSNIQGIRTLLIGGDIKKREHTHATVGSGVTESFPDIYVDKAFIGVDGISFRRGYTIHDSDDLLAATRVSKCTNELIVVADHTKFEKIAFCQAGDLCMAHKVISDELVPEEYMEYYFKNNVQIFTTYKLDV